MKWNMKISEIFLTVLFIFSALSSLLTQIPVIRNSIVFFILLLAQLLFVFIFHHNIKKMKIYGTVITALAVSNIINGIIAWCWAYQSINSISVPIKQGTDILGIVMAKASFGMFAYLISGIAIVVFAECIVSVFIKYRTKKKQQLIHNIENKPDCLNKKANPFYYVDTLKQPDQITVGLIIYALSALNSLAFFKAASFCFFFLITLSRLNSSRSFSSSASEMNLTVSSKRGIIMFLRAFALF